MHRSPGMITFLFGGVRQIPLCRFSFLKNKNIFVFLYLFRPADGYNSGNNIAKLKFLLIAATFSDCTLF